MKNVTYFKMSLLILLAIFLLSETQKGDATMLTNEKENVKSIVEKAYIEGIHTTQNESAIRSGFHKDFAMLVYKDEGIEKVTVKMWLKRIEQMKKDNPNLWKAKTHYNSMQISITGYAASVQLDTYKGDTFFSTDYLLLYKFKDGWKIVSKIYTITK